MNRHDFFAELRRRLNGIPKNDLEERISFFNEMIDDRVEEGMSEIQAVTELGTLESICKQILSEMSLTKLARERIRPKRSLHIWEVILLVIGSPIWGSVLFALFIIVVCAYALLWSAVISLWAIELSVAVCSVASVISMMLFIAKGNTVTGIAMLGAGLIFSGVVVYGFYGCKSLCNIMIKISGKMYMRIKSGFAKKGAAR